MTFSKNLFNCLKIHYKVDLIALITVPVAPLIRVSNPSVGVANGSWAVLECNVEAFPESLCYWERFDGRSIETQHRASLRDYGKYQVK